MREESQVEGLETIREVEQEITEGLALLGRWSHLFEKLKPAQKETWKAIVAKSQGSEDRANVCAELDAFITNTLRPMVERLD